MKKLMLTFATIALATASAASYRVTVYQPSVVGGTELKPGDYKIELKDNKAVIKTGKETVEAPVKVETGDQKFNSTAVRYQNDGGKMKVNEIRIGGTNTKLVFESGAATVSEAR
jgi:hypothetical protein